MLKNRKHWINVDTPMRQVHKRSIPNGNSVIVTADGTGIIIYHANVHT